MTVLKGNSPRLKIAILGTRGIPARYGGFETFAEYLSSGLHARGHEVTVYGRKSWREGLSTDSGEVNGVKTRRTPTIMQKYCETPLHGLSSFLDAMRQDFDCAIVCNAANSPFSFLLRLAGIPFTTNVDGIERERAKWNSLGKAWYLLGENTAVRFSDRIVSDAEVIAEYYNEKFSISSEVIAYGADFERFEAGPVLAEFGLKAREYILYVSRLEPENNALGVIQAYKNLNTDVPLVIVGDAPYATEYKRSLREAAQGSEVVFTGFQFAEAYRELLSNCQFYIQATEVGGTHPALVESMAVGNAIIANGTPENHEVLADAGRLYKKNDFEELAEIMREYLEKEELRRSLGASARERASRKYSWDAVVDSYEELFRSLVSGDFAPGGKAQRAAA